MLKLKEMRIKNNLSVDEVAKFLNVSTMAVYNYESGKRGVKLEIIKKLVELYGCSVTDLLDWGDLCKI